MTNAWTILDSAFMVKRMLVLSPWLAASRLDRPVTGATGPGGTDYHNRVERRVSPRNGSRSPLIVSDHNDLSSCPSGLSPVRQGCDDGTLKLQPVAAVL
ncbi:hypothetical protein RRG08_016495 [Elysia crispata]|uniref:Uncharacterized protein n=1 Tax=Elysia crispata TaxID=231223 RepID=A0AAE0Y9E2_9GAST|nr:hypothetical protein RRG08_016495 [Elysia crispata]